MRPPRAKITRRAQSTRVPEKMAVACCNSTTRMRTSPDYSRDTIAGSEWESSQPRTRRTLGTIRLLAPKRKKATPSKCVSSIQPTTNKHSQKQAPTLNGYIGSSPLPQQPTAPVQRSEDKPLSIMAMEFFGRCYFEVTQRQTPAGILQQLKMVLMSDLDHHKAAFLKIQKHFDSALNLAIEALKVKAFLAEDNVMVFDDAMNADLLHIEMACIKLPPEYRDIIFSYLADHLPFPKCFLLVYVRFLRVTSVQRRLRGLLERLRANVNKEMPEQLQHYEWELSMAKRLQWQQQADVDILEPGTICEQTIDSNLLPSPQFQWSKTTQELLWNILETKMSMLPAEKNGDLSDSKRLVLFLNEKIVNIWPEGWMDADGILHEARRKL